MSFITFIRNEHYEHLLEYLWLNIDYGSRKVIITDIIKEIINFFYNIFLSNICAIHHYGDVDIHRNLMRNPRWANLIRNVNYWPYLLKFKNLFIAKAELYTSKAYQIFSLLLSEYDQIAILTRFDVTCVLIYLQMNNIIRINENLILSAFDDGHFFIYDKLINYYIFSRRIQYRTIGIRFKWQSHYIQNYKRFIKKHCNNGFKQLLQDGN